MAQKSKGHLFPHHAAAVIGHTYEGDAALFDFHGNGGGTGVDGILHQLLHHGGGTLHHLAGRYFIYGILI